MSPSRLAPFAFIATGTVLGSYATAVYVDEMKRKRLRERLRSSWDSHRRHYSPEFSLKREWAKLSSSQQTIYSIIALNSAVFIAWKVPACSRILNRYFLHAINSHPLGMLGSIFSHRSLTHLAFNMLALNSFGSFLHDRMGREHFCAFYLSAGTASSFGSHLYKCFRLNFTPSLGASGAIFGIVGACGHFPSLKVSLILLPVHSIPISTALPVLMGVDLIGLVKNWSIFDHAAHLSGAAYGYLAFPFSEQIWSNRRLIVKYISPP